MKTMKWQRIPSKSTMKAARSLQKILGAPSPSSPNTISGSVGVKNRGRFSIQLDIEAIANTPKEIEFTVLNWLSRSAIITKVMKIEVNHG